MLRSMLCVVCVLAGAGAAASSEFDQLRQLMSCYDDPSPTPVLEGLSSGGSIFHRYGPGGDGDYCWDLKPTLLWNGLAFRALCVVTDDAGSIASNPQFYWDGAMAPWTEVWLLADTSRANLQQWAVATLGDDSHFEIDPADGADTSAALSCSEWRFPLKD